MIQNRKLARTGGNPGGTPLYRPYRNVPHQRVWLWSFFGLKTSTDFAYFAHIGLKSGNVYEGNIACVAGAWK